MILKKTFIALTALALSQITSAGLVQLAPLEITPLDDGGFFVSGDMKTARFSDNEHAFIGCGTRTTLGQSEDGEFFTASTGHCNASISEDETIVCFTDEPGLIEKIASISDLSFIQFAVNAEGECIHIGVSTKSFYLGNRN